MGFTTEDEHLIKRLWVSEKKCSKTIAYDAFLTEDNDLIG